MLKISHYNFFIETEDNHVLLYNSRTGAVAAVSLPQYQDIKTLLNSPFPKTPSDKEIIANLEKGGFLIKEDVEEIGEIRKAYENYKQDNKITLTLLASETCNFSCPYCFIYERRGFNMEPWVYDATLAYIKKNASAGTKVKINWFGGEPTLDHNNIVGFSTHLNELLKECNLDKPVHTMVTNGYLLTKDKVEKYVELGINILQITLDGNESSHNKTRCLTGGGKTFDTIWNNLVDLKSIKSRFEMSIRVNFLKGMEKEIQDLTQRFASTFGMDDRFWIYFRPVYSFETKRQDACSLKDDIYSVDEGIHLQMKYSLEAATIMGKLRKSTRSTSPVPGPIPAWCETEKKNSFIIGADGLIFKCDSYIGTKGQAVAKITAAGDIERIPGAYNWDRNIYKETEDNKCLDCKLLPVCQGGCPRLRMEKKKSCFFNESHIKTALLETHAFNLKLSANRNKVR